MARKLRSRSCRAACSRDVPSSSRKRRRNRPGLVLAGSAVLLGPAGSAAHLAQAALPAVRGGRADRPVAPEVLGADRADRPAAPEVLARRARVADRPATSAHHVGRAASARGPLVAEAPMRRHVASARAPRRSDPPVPSPKKRNAATGGGTATTTNNPDRVTVRREREEVAGGGVR